MRSVAAQGNTCGLRKCGRVGRGEMHIRAGFGSRVEELRIASLYYVDPPAREAFLQRPSVCRLRACFLAWRRSLTRRWILPGLEAFAHYGNKWVLYKFTIVWRSCT